MDLKRDLPILHALPCKFRSYRTENAWTFHFRLHAFVNNFTLTVDTILLQIFALPLLTKWVLCIIRDVVFARVTRHPAHLWMRIPNFCVSNLHRPFLSEYYLSVESCPPPLLCRCFHFFAKTSRIYLPFTLSVGRASKRYKGVGTVSQVFEVCYATL